MSNKSSRPADANLAECVTVYRLVFLMNQTCFKVKNFKFIVADK